MADLLTDEEVLGSASGGSRLLSDAEVMGHAGERKGREVPLAARPFVGANRAIADMAGAPVDLYNRFIGKPFARLFTGREQEEGLPGGSETFKKGLGLVGANPDDVRPASTPGEKILEAGGEGVASMLVPGLGAEAAITRAGSKAPGLIAQTLRGGGPISNTTMGAAGGVAGEVAAEAAPEPWKPTARLVGGLVGGGAAAAAETAVDRVATSAAKWAAGLFEPAEMTAARTIESRAANPEKLRADLSNATAAEAPGDVIIGKKGDYTFTAPGLREPETVPGSTPTTFQATGDLGVGALEREVATNQGAVERFAQRRQEQNAARTTALNSLADAEANPEVVADFVKARLAELTDTHAARVKDATQAVADRLAVAGGDKFDNPAAYGEALRGPLSELHQDAKSEASKLWRAIDPDLSAPVQAGPLKQAAAELLDSIPQAAKPPAGEESSILRTIEEMGDTTHFGNLVALRSRLTDALREERREGTPTVLRRLSIMLDNVDNTLANTAGQIAADPQRAPGLIQRLQAELDARFPKNGETGAAQARGSLGAGNEAPVSAGEGNVPAVTGGAGQAGRQPGVPAGDQGVQAVWRSAESDFPVTLIDGTVRAYDGRLYQRVQYQGRDTYVPADELVRSPAPGGAPGSSSTTGPAASSVDQPALDVGERYAAARQATRELKQTYESGPVGSVLAPGGQYGSFKTTASNVAKRLFERPEDLQAFIGAAKDNPELPKIMADYAAFSMRQAAARDGLISPTKLDRWVADHGYVFDQFPALRTKFADAKAAQATLDEAIATQKEALANYQTRTVSDLLKGEDPVRAVGNALRRPGDLAALVETVKGNPAAEAGLKRAAVEYMLGAARSTAEAGTSDIAQLNAATLQKFFLNNRRALGDLFSKDELANIAAVVADLRQANRSIVAVKIPGGSNTAQDTAGRLTTLLQRFAAEHGGKGLGSVFGSFGGPIGSTLGFMGGTALDSARAARSVAVEKALTEMMLSPKMAAEWLRKIPRDAGDSFTEGFVRRMRAAAASDVERAIDREGGAR